MWFANIQEQEKLQENEKFRSKRPQILCVVGRTPKVIKSLKYQIATPEPLHPSRLLQ
jgi:hypothetical protein